MPRLFVAVYLVPGERHPLQNGGPVAHAFYSACRDTGFPYDVGDDPSLFSAPYHGGPVTWGVCRPDVRGQIESSDCVAFFAAERTGPNTTYRFTAALQVDKSVSPLSIWSLEGAPYSAYLNLLVRPRGDGWEHYEPALDEAVWHSNWLWRVCDRRGHRKAAIVAASRLHCPGNPLPARTSDDAEIAIADNYVVFSKKHGFILRNPIGIAKHDPKKPRETWGDDSVSAAIRRHVFGALDRGLRTANLYQPHRHTVRSIADSKTWMAHLRQIVRGRSGVDLPGQSPIWAGPRRAMGGLAPTRYAQRQTQNLLRADETHSTSKPRSVPKRSC